MGADLVCERGVPLLAQAFLVVDEKLLLVRDIREETGDLEVQPLDLLVCAQHLEMLVHCHPPGREGPWLIADVVPSLTQEVEFRQEGVLNDLLPG
jgi:hypothetical protein